MLARRPTAVEEGLVQVVGILRRAAESWAVPVVGHYAETPFKVLISCLLSLRTLDTTTDAASARLFRAGRTPRALRAFPTARIARLIYPVAFYRVKARQIKAICKMLQERWRGKVPAEIDALLALPGVGRKTANLVRTLGFGKPGICVDVHVHRITNRWGYLRTRTPDETETALRAKLPRRYWVEWNELLVAYGQHICRPVSPFCSRCPLRPYCARVGVTSSR